MKVVILAGGFGTRISEDSHSKPKPMIEIGGVPILLHILRFYYKQGFTDFIICGGYKCYYVKEYFSNYFLHNSDVTFDFKNNSNEVKYENSKCENWKITVVDTGLDTQTAGRIKKIEKYIGNDENFMLTYGDGLSDIDLFKLKNTHKNNIVTLSSVQLQGKFGSLKIKNNSVLGFNEKSKDNGGWINAGFMVLNKKIFNYIKNDSDSLEFDILPKIANENNLKVYKHQGFWKCMDTLKDKNEFEKIIKDGKALW